MNAYEKNSKKSKHAKIKSKKYKSICFSKYLVKYLSLFVFSLLIYKNSFTDISKLILEPGRKYIFTFWEPRRKIPGYLRLCIETWKKFLPEYHIKILDYNNLKYYLGDSLFLSIICKEMIMPIQADGIRVAMLKKYGGIWMDTDTIILGREFLNDLKDTELAMFGDDLYKSQHIGFIYASNTSFLINEWLEQIKKKIYDYKKVLSKKHNNMDINWINSFKKLYTWSMLGNRIIDPLLKNITDKRYYSRLDKHKMNVFPENKYFENNFQDNIKRYREFYFKKGDIEYIINEVKKGIILLHNSWTPQRFKKMTAKRFIRNDIRISKLLAKLLNNVTL